MSGLLGMMLSAAIGVVILFGGCQTGGCGDAVEAPGSRDYSKLKIAPPPDGGMYVGQYEWMPGDIEAFEKAIGRNVAFWSKHKVIGYDASQGKRVVFYPEAAEKAWREGKVVYVHAYEIHPLNDEMVDGFTVDKLLMGVYDDDLRRLAGQFRQFGKPMFFMAAREPNGVGADYFGGFGPNGDKTTDWALENKRGFEEFDPSRFPHAHLYSDLGGPNVSDGAERIVAGHRYYYDFFVRREGCAFLTFDTNALSPADSSEVEQNLDDVGPDVDKEYALRLLRSSQNWENLYPGDEFVDWVSFNFHMVDYYAEDWVDVSWGYKGAEDRLVPHQYYFDILEHAMKNVRRIAPGKPVILMECSFPDGRKQDSARAAGKVRVALTEFITKYPEINAIAMWSDAEYWQDFWPYDSLIRPDTRQAKAFQEMIGAYPDRFHFCVYLSDGKPLSACKR